jgi:hypothetical protein
MGLRRGSKNFGSFAMSCGTRHDAQRLAVELNTANPRTIAAICAAVSGASSRPALLSSVSVVGRG